MKRIKSALADISAKTVERYSDRYSRFGRDVRTLGWGTRGQQEYRFIQTLEYPQYIKDRTVLDVGCGFGDYYKLLRERGLRPKNYTGWDIKGDLIKESVGLWHADRRVAFRKRNLIDVKDRSNAVADTVVMLGVLNFNLKTSFDNYEYSRMMIRKAFGLARGLLIVDFLSSHITPAYPKEDFVFYHDPEEVLKYALSLSGSACLKHDYLPIPQKEFMLFIFKEKKGL